MKEKQPIGVKEIARKANVSIATVDRVLHNRPGVSASTKKKIEGLIKQYNYQPNILARRLASKKILRFAALIPFTSKETDYWLLPLEGIEEAEEMIKPFGVTIEKYFFDQNKEDTFITQAKKVIKSSPDGILLAPIFVKESEKIVAKFDQLKIPYVFINSDIPDLKNLAYCGPNLYSNGYMGAHLVDFFVEDNDTVLIINISAQADNLYYLFKKEEGFRDFFEKEGKKINIVKADIKKTDYISIKKELNALFKKHPINVVFVTNSRAFYVARYFEEAGIKDTMLFGHEFIEKNIHYLENKTIDFLICQKPKDQAYQGIMALYNSIVKDEVVEKNNYMSIDIITKENYKFYKN